MKPGRWTQIESICQQAIDLEGIERIHFLNQACSGDRELLTEIESLLDQLESGLLQEPLVQMTSSLIFSGREPTGEMFIGPYRLIRTIAAGGMGEVWLALRDDDAFNRHVALKVIRQEYVSDEALTRFLSERQILASLNHPYIARLFDGGATENGLPWFAMEYVEGLPVTDFCNRRNDSVEDRIMLFLKICTAVQYAHQNLVVHRDLKPGNILITPEGDPKLLDFGISGILSPGQNNDRIRLYLRRLTPEYASPEQVREEAVSTVSDVYSLGVLLYELLAGTLPYDLGKRTPRDMEKAICEAVPEKASLISGNKRLSGDLDKILSKALKKIPADRYLSVEQFAGDLRRHLDGFPVIARNDSLRYRASKFVRRNRWGVAGSAVIATLILLFGTLSLIQSAEIRSRALEVEQQRDRAERVSEFLVGLFASADPSEARDESISAVELLNRGVIRAEEELNGQPDLQSELFLVISDVYESLGLYREAEDLARRSYDVRMDRYGPGDAGVAAALNAMGWLRYRQGELGTADTLLQEALSVRRALYGDEHLDVARSMNDLAVVRQAVGNYASTDSLLHTALNIRRDLLGNDHEAVGITLNNYAALKWQMGDLAETEELMREVLTLLQSKVGDEDLRVAVAMTNLAALLLSNGELAEAESLYRDALEVRLKLVGDQHPDVAFSLAHLGNLLRMKEEYAEAEELLRRALDLRQELHGAEHMLTGDSRRTLGIFYYQTGDYTLAEAHYESAIGIFRTLFPDGHVRTAEVLQLLGELCLDTERPYLAEPLFREALGIRVNHFGEEDLRTGTTRIQLGISLTALEQFTEAESQLEAGLNVLHRLSNSPDELKKKAEMALAAIRQRGTGVTTVP